jgi:hypothetical protein
MSLPDFSMSAPGLSINFSLETCNVLQRGTASLANPVISEILQAFEAPVQSASQDQSGVYDMYVLFVPEMAV